MKSLPKIINLKNHKHFIVLIIPEKGTQYMRVLFNLEHKK